MQSWLARLGLMLAMLSMLIVAAVPAMASHDGDDDECWEDGEWICEVDDAEFDGFAVEVAEIELEGEIVCWFDGELDELDGLDNDGDLEIDEGDIDCEIVWDD